MACCTEGGTTMNGGFPTTKLSQKIWNTFLQRRESSTTTQRSKAAAKCNPQIKRHYWHPATMSNVQNGEIGTENLKISGNLTATMQSESYLEERRVPDGFSGKFLVVQRCSSRCLVSMCQDGRTLSPLWTRLKIYRTCVRYSPHQRGCPVFVLLHNAALDVHVGVSSTL